MTTEVASALKDAILTRLERVSGPDHDGNYKALCPFHDDHTPSLSVNFARNAYNCFGCGSSGSISRLAQVLGIVDVGPRHDKGNSSDGQPEIVATYDYIDPSGNLLYQVVRYEPKDFRQRRPDDNGDWLWNVKGVKPVLYRLPDVERSVAAGETIFVVEGEKDVNALWNLGLAATTNSGGAGKWKQGHSEALRGADVVIIRDNDSPGRDHATKVAASLHGAAKSIKVLELPDGDGGPVMDVSDWLQGGGTASELQALIREAPEWNAPESNGAGGLVCMLDVEAEAVSWLWHPYIPLGKLTLLEGDPGVGKSWASLGVATAVSLGRGLPGVETAQPQRVLLASAEDGLGDTIRPRLDAIGADVANIHAVKDALDFGDSGLAVLEVYIAKVQPKLVVIDPLVAYLGAGVDLHRANETRAVMAGLADIAERHGCAMLAIRHLTKGGMAKPIYRGLGSIDFAAACRSVLLVGCDPDNPQARGIVQIKSNLAATGPGIGFEVRDGGFYWTGESDLTWQAILSAEDNIEGKSALDDAVDFLKDELGDGPAEAAQVWRDAREAGLSEKTVKRAKAMLGVVTRRQGETGRRGAGKWAWELPQLSRQDDLESQNDLEGQEGLVETLGPLNHARHENVALPQELDPLNQAQKTRGKWGEL